MNNTSHAQLTSTHKKQFSELVKEGSYSHSFKHNEKLQEFFDHCISIVLDFKILKKNISVLDCGCGTGVWLEHIYNRLTKEGLNDIELYGFDLTEELVCVSKERLSEAVKNIQLHIGDILDSNSYIFSRGKKKFDLIYVYDVIQQLNRKTQYEAIELILKQLSNDGVLIIFDHDALSKHGIRMSFRKLVTKYLKIGLVPLYYCNARYPYLERFAKRLKKDENLVVEIITSQVVSKRAMIIRHK